MTLTQQPNKIKLLIKKLIILTLVSFSFFMLAFNLLEIRYVDSYYSNRIYENGFSLLSFEGNFLGNYEEGLAIFLGLLCLNAFSVSLVLIPLAVLNLIFKISLIYII